EDDAAVLQDDRVEGLGDVEVADLLHVGAVVVHDEQLDGPLPTAGRLQAVAVADEGDAAPRQRAGVHVVNAVPPGGAVPVPRLQGGGPRVGRPLLPREADDLPRLHMDLVDVGAAGAADVVEVGVVDPPGVEGDVGVGDRAFAARHQHLLAAV